MICGHLQGDAIIQQDVLDMKKNGFVSWSDIEDFIESMENS